jgi:hypothetical protein
MNFSLTLGQSNSKNGIPAFIKDCILFFILSHDTHHENKAKQKNRAGPLYA